MLATGFAVLLGFVVFLAFTSYDSARALAIIDQELEVVGADQPLPCDAQGNPLGAG